MTTTTTTAKPNLAFDIDETLSNTVLYYVQEMQKRFGNPEFLSAEEIIHKYPEAQIIAKPFLDNDTAGSVWKAKKLLSLSPKIEAIVDDNIALVQTFDNLETNY